MNLSGAKDDRYTGIVSNMLDLPAKGNFSIAKFRVAGHLYDDKLHKLRGEKSMDHGR